MQQRAIRIGPVAFGNAAANLLNCAISSLSGPVGFTATQPYLILTHVRVVNKTNAAATFSLFMGATGASAAGTEWAFNTTQVAANGTPNNYVDWFGRARMDAADFLTGLASAATTLTFEAEGEIGFA